MKKFTSTETEAMVPMLQALLKGILNVAEVNITIGYKPEQLEQEDADEYSQDAAGRTSVDRQIS